MKHLFILFSLFFSFILSAQDSPVEYMKRLNSDGPFIMNKNWELLKAIAYDDYDNMAKISNEMKQTIRQSVQNVSNMGPYNGDDEFRKATLNYYNHNMELISGKTNELVDMKKISEESYDALEAYIMYQRQMNEINKNEVAKLHKAQETFAKKHDVELVEGTSELAEKIEKASKILSYSQNLQLVIARCSMYEIDMLSRMDSEEDYNFGQAGLTLLDLVDKSRAALDTISSPNSDLKLKQQTAKYLDFFEDEATNLIPKVNQFHKDKNTLNNEMKDFESHPEYKQDKSKVEALNKKISSMNDASNELNNSMKKYNMLREQNYKLWNMESNAYIRKFMPK